MMFYKNAFFLSIVWTTVCLCLVTCGTSTNQKGTATRPNIIVIMADDMGFSDLGSFGGEIATPNIDGLAENGLVMTQFYNTSRCCPSRAALLTGIYQHEAGVGNMNGNMGYPAYQGYLNEQCVTIAEVLKESGYATMMSGKWHLGDAPEHWPRQRGFDRFFGIPQGGGVYFFPFRKGRDLILDDETVTMVDTASFYTTDAFNDYAVQFIEEHMSSQTTDEAQPFFLYLPHIAPHFPLQAWEDDIEKYRGKYKEGFQAIREKRYEKLKGLGLLQEDFPLPPSDEEVLDWDRLSESEKDDYDLRMSVYAAQMESMDRGIGKIMDTLKELDIYDNTVVMFFSDNGGTHEAVSSDDADGPIGSKDSFTSYSRSWANVSNTPFRMYKHWVHEGGISSPLIISYPKLIRERRLSNELAHIMDIMPTCIDLAKTTYPDTYKEKTIKPLRGKSLMPLFQSQERDGHEFLFWEHQGNKAVRKGDWKLVAKHGNDNWELYHIATDRTELKDQSQQHPELVEEMALAYQNWAEEAGVMPWGFKKR